MDEYESDEDFYESDEEGGYGSEYESEEEGYESEEEKYMSTYSDLSRISMQGGDVPGKLSKYSKITMTPTEIFRDSFNKAVNDFEVEVSRTDQNKFLNICESIPDYLTKNPSMMFLSMYYVSKVGQLNSEKLNSYKKYLKDGARLPDLFRYIKFVKKFM